MKKKLLKFAGVFAIAISSLSAFSQANLQGSIIVDPYYGFPNFGKSLYSSFESLSSDYKATGIGPAGLRAEYLVSEKIGVGFDFIYNSNRTTYSTSDTTSTYDGNTETYSTVITLNSVERSMQRVRFQARINFHFDISNPSLDGYFGVAAGTNNRFRKYIVNGVEATDELTDAFSSFTLIPFSLRICTGLRYYFTPNIGLNMELGLGGPMVSAGVSVKIR